MPLSQQTIDLLSAFKTCSDTEIVAAVTPILKEFPRLPVSEKKELAENIYKWTEENKILQHKYPFGNYMLSLNAFFNEAYEDALHYSSEAQKLFIGLQDSDCVALCYSVSGAIFRTLGNPGLALTELWEAYEQLKKSGNFKHNCYACLFHIASIYSELTNYDEAVPLFQALLKSSLEEKDANWIINSLQGLGKIYMVQKKFSEAKDSFEKALVFAKQLKSPMLISVSQTDLADYYSKATNFSEAEKLAMEALELREANKLIGGAVTNCIQLGTIYIEENKQGEAINVLEKGLKMAQEIKVKPKIYQIHQLLSAIYQSKNDLEKSLLHYKLFHNLQEEVEREQAANKLKNLKLAFEAEQTKKENAIIKKQKEEIEKKNIELQDTIDELTRTRVGKKAKIFTLVIGITLFVTEEIIAEPVFHFLPKDNFSISLIAKVIIVFSLKPIDQFVEHSLLKRIIKKQKQQA